MAFDKEIFTESLRYWEKKRFIYNGALFVLAVAILGTCYSVSGAPTPSVMELWWLGFFLVVSAVAANVLYCAAYIVDVFVQHSAFQEMWKGKPRDVLFVGGVVFACLLTWFVGMMLAFSFFSAWSME